MLSLTNRNEKGEPFYISAEFYFFVLLINFKNKIESYENR